VTLVTTCPVASMGGDAVGRALKTA